MRNRSVLLALGVLGLLAVLVWSLRSNGRPSDPVKPATAEGVSSERADPAVLSAPAARDGARPPTEREVPAAKVPEEPPPTETSEATEPPAPMEPVEPPKPSSLEPILGGENAFRARHAASTYEDRARRVASLESALSAGEPEDKTQSEAYAALKEELLWLRDNLGAPPPAPK